MSARARGKKTLRAAQSKWPDGSDGESDSPDTHAYAKQASAKTPTWSTSQSQVAHEADTEPEVESPDIAQKHAEEDLQVMAPNEIARLNAGPVATHGTAPQYRDITDLLNLPQSEAAKVLNIPTSTLSKRWKEAVRNRKWPFRSISKLDKEIMTLLHNIQPREVDGSSATPPEIELALGLLLRKRQDELKPVRIRL